MFKVAWDNGVSACGVFPNEFNSPEDAEMWGAEWAQEMNALDGIRPDDPEGYSYEVIPTGSEFLARG